ncbi:hypothetical protein Hypma_009806 [Hypsizygus marmoreus]|uniref:Uncharacterized protein n=1 Tax=Hypsizygus marmoreus TaxID=39966 RepID=A0A369JRG6_HYPMA|nr:hypothetical protein Hypma_009806 [Hypsizygus marmoreus]
MCAGERDVLKCLNPRKCRNTANAILACLPEKWNPKAELNPSVKDLTEDELEANKAAALKKGGTLIFNPVTVRMLSDGFRAITKVSRISEPPASQENGNDMDAVADCVAISITHAVVKMPSAERIVGGAAWFEHQDALEKVPKGSPLKIEMSVKSILVALTTDLPRLENTGWMGRENSDTLRAIAAALCGRSARVELLMLTSRGDPNGLRGSRDLTRHGTEREADDVAEQAVTLAFSLEGVKLASGSQTIFYTGILTKTEVSLRRPTLIKLDITRHAVKEISGSLPTDTQI